MTEVKRVFKVDGKPFFPLGGQTNNSSGYSSKQSELPLRQLNYSMVIPWNPGILEPDRAQTGGFLTSPAWMPCWPHAHKYDIKLIILWFATGKTATWITPRTG